MERTFHMLLYRAFHAQRNALRPHLGELGLGAGQPKVLGYLIRNGASRQRQLAEYCEIDPAAISRMLDSMQKGGFVTREADEENRRCERIQITDRGWAAYGAWEGFCGEMEQQMLAGFTDQERAQFADYLGRAYRNLKEGGESGT
ncbi:MarR family winged helix-turn-helix transcriptional regulator [Intestinimonas massiliensis (ex Afouda et al. 2020)]|uniref:MarR family winged helix-turn-helix transcriptional regulator n=1 Tax=Intestinimonas massiliensis (ex Afouda et al. 2020) TaxID=1673721 RepID=UPI0010319817|nr:MarR family transcriptional regulator [Intestinimonas massiliensis (ex Afouda et al. 2020)]